MQLRRGLLGPLFVAALIGGSAALVPAAPSAAVTSAAASTSFRLDLAGGTDFVAQTNFVQCVGASMQMMLNIMDAQDDRTARTQLELQNLARDLSGPGRTGFQRKGASVRGWSAGLNLLGAGPYRLIGTDTIEEALRLAARSISQTGKPVGLLVWSGRHAWVMSGFQATADPSVTNDYTVTRAIVMDPLYPYGSAKWGRSPKPREALTPATLGKQFVPRRGGSWAGTTVSGPSASSLSGFSGKYVIVMPFVPTLIAGDRHIAT
jgi:hypothetical protein